MSTSGYDEINHQELVECIYEPDKDDDDHLNKLSDILNYIRNDIQMKELKLKNTESTITNFPCMTTRMVYDEVQRKLQQTKYFISEFFKLIPRIREMNLKYGAIISDIENSKCHSSTGHTSSSMTGISTASDTKDVNNKNDEPMMSTDHHHANSSNNCNNSNDEENDGVNNGSNHSKDDAENKEDENSMSFGYPFPIPEERNQRLFFNMFDNPSEAFAEAYAAYNYPEPLSSANIASILQKNFDIDDLNQNGIMPANYNKTAQIPMTEAPIMKPLRGRPKKILNTATIIDQKSMVGITYAGTMRKSSDGKIIIPTNIKACPVTGCNRPFNNINSVKYHICSIHPEESEKFQLSPTFMRIAYKKLETRKKWPTMHGS